MKRFFVILALVLMAIPAMAASPTIDETSCKAQGGRWHPGPGGRGRFEGCEIKYKDANKSCRDGSECQSSTCMVDETICNGTVNKYPKGNGFEKCQLKATCLDTSRPPLGCHLFLEKGKIKNLCLD